MPAVVSEMGKSRRKKAVVAWKSEGTAVGAVACEEAYVREQQALLKVGVKRKRVDVADPVAGGGGSNGSFRVRNETSVLRREDSGRQWSEESCISENGREGDESVGVGSLHSGSAGHVPSSIMDGENVQSRQGEVDADITESEEGELVKKARISDGERVLQYISKWSVFVSPPLRTRVRDGERIQVGSGSYDLIPPQFGHGSWNRAENRNVFTEKTTNMEITVNHKIVKVTLTRESRVAQEWIEKQSGTNFGLDLEWQPTRRKGQKDNKVALLQISTETECLLVQMLFLDNIPDALAQFLSDPEKKIAGVGIYEDTKKLQRDYGLVCAGEVELTTLAVAHLMNDKLKRAGLKNLAKLVLGLDMKKPKSVTMSNWSRSHLGRSQVEYACMDAWVSLAIFCRLQKNALLA